MWPMCEINPTGVPRWGPPGVWLSALNASLCESRDGQGKRTENSRLWG